MLKIISTRYSFVKTAVCTITMLLKNLQNNLNQSIQIVKHVNKIAERLGNPSTSSKCYCSLLKTLLNGKKIPCIPPLVYGDKYIVDFQEKSEIFNSFFADKCSLISNESILLSELPLRTDSAIPYLSLCKRGHPSNNQ